jgi:hypothetical protein
MLALLGTMGKIADLLPKMASPTEQIQDILAACECFRDNLEQETAPECLNLLQTIEATAKTDNYPSLHMYIKKLESTFSSEVKIKLEVLFLPYKVSMWDSLESIYLAAKDDPGCDAYVMPIPYYDKKDGKFTEMHWETDYPQSISLIDYRKYNIEERRPDIIFIHNPYDDCNIVTCVHPDFYSQKLRNFTDCLVYVPYFVGDGINIQEHFCTLPACIFAHKVIVKTEQEREIYVRVYKHFARNNDVPERFDRLEDKFLALGSPKLDKAINAKREDYQIPPEWERLVKNNKKVVFYNTSIGSLLYHTVEGNKPSNRYLQKLKNVFEFFKKQNNAVLLWRPHPLLENTIKSMRPWLEKEYAEIVDKYKTEGYGIYDDTQDLNRSIAMSDMYYGDGSSVVQLFETAKKPIVWQAIGMLSASALYDDGMSIWSVDGFNMLYKHDKQSKKTEYMGTLPVQKDWEFTAIAGNSRKLYFASALGYGIFVFDMDKKVFEQNIPCNYGIQSIVSYKNFIYLIPTEFSAILKIALDTNEITYFSEWLGEVAGLRGNWKQVCVIGSEIAMIMQGKGTILFFNMETEKYVMEKIETNSELYNDMCFDGHNYYLIPFKENCIVKWNRKSNKISKIKLPNSFSKKEGSDRVNFLIKYFNKHIWLFPHAANKAYKINTDTNKITELPKLTEYFEDKNLDWHYNVILANDNSIYVSTINKGIAEFNINTSELNFIKLSAAENFTEPNLLLYLSDREIPAEWERYIKNADGTRKKVVFYNMNIGVLLENRDRYLQKLKEIFEFFKERDDAVLLWRSNSWFEREYAEIVDEYRTGNYGIYDDTENLDRAVALSDICYGDESGVANLFRMAAKPVLVQSLMTNFRGFSEDGIYIWFIDIFSNVLYRYNRQNEKTEYTGIIPAQNNWAYSGIAANNNKLYFAPFFKNDKISVFDTVRKSFEQINFKDNCKYERKFKAVVSFKNFVYFIPQEFPAIMRFNTDTKEIEYFSEWIREFSKLHIFILQDAWKNAMFFGFCVVDAEIAMMINGANAVMFFNMETGGYEIKSIGEKSEQCNHICFDGQNYYLTPLYKDYIIKWDRQSNKILKIKLPSFSRKENIGANFSIQYLNEHIWLFPAAANNAYKININTNEITELSELMEHFEVKVLDWHYGGFFYKNENSIYTSTESKGIVEYNINTRKLNFIESEPRIDYALIPLLSNDKAAENSSGTMGKAIYEEVLCNQKFQ